MLTEPPRFCSHLWAVMLMAVACDGGVTPVGAVNEGQGVAGEAGAPDAGASGGTGGSAGSAGGGAVGGAGMGGFGVGGSSSGGAPQDPCAAPEVVFQDRFDRTDGVLGTNEIPGSDWNADPGMVLIGGEAHNQETDSRLAFSSSGGPLGNTGLVLRFRTRFPEPQGEVEVRLNSAGFSLTSGVGVALRGPASGGDVAYVEQGRRPSPTSTPLPVGQDIYVEATLAGLSSEGSVATGSFASQGGSVIRIFRPLVLLQTETGSNVLIRLDGVGGDAPIVDEITITSCAP